MKLLAALFTSIGAFLLIGLAAAQPAAAFDIFGQPCTASSNQGTVCQEKAKPQDAAGDNSIYGKGGILAKAITIVDIIVGLGAVIMIIVGGLKYILSNGDSNGANSARQTVLYAVIGMVIAVIGQSIVIFVLNRL